MLPLHRLITAPMLSLLVLDVIRLPLMAIEPKPDVPMP
jgi:hypothetical protein